VGVYDIMVNMKTHEQLINNIIGQLNGIKKMVSDERDCLEILIQVKATKSALNSLTNKLAAGTIMHCATPKNSKDKTVMEKLLKELSDN